MNNRQNDLLLEDGSWEVAGRGPGRDGGGGGGGGVLSFAAISFHICRVPALSPSPFLSSLLHEFYSEHRNADESDCRFAALKREVERSEGVVG